MTGKIDPKSPRSIAGGGYAFMAVGAAFFAIGMTDRSMLAFIGVAVAFFVIGLGMVAKARKTETGGTGEGEK
ncbi:hypothetical protein BH09PSE1_BH09PSE1_28150 [soil metagenome]